MRTDPRTDPNLLKFKRFGKLFVLGVYGKDSKGRRLLTCWCSCGNLAVVREDNLKQTATTGKKNTTSCGCVKTAVWTNYDSAKPIRQKMRLAAKKRMARAGGENNGT